MDSLNFQECIGGIKAVVLEYTCLFLELLEEEVEERMDRLLHPQPGTK